MRAREYLKKIDNYKFDIVRLEATNERLRTTLEGSGIAYDSVRVQTSPKDSMSETMTQIADNCAKICKLKDKIRIIENQINELENGDYRKMLLLVYDMGLSVAKATKSMNKSYSRGKHIHIEALKKFEERYLKDEV